MKIRDFLIGVGASVDTASFNNAEKSMGSLKSQALAVGSALAGIGAGVWYLKSIVDQASNAGDATAKLARNLGLSAEALQEWQHIAGLENFDVSTAFKFLAKNMAEAKDGVKTSLDAFNRLNVSVTNADGTLRSYDEVLMDVAENFPKLSEAERVQTAMDIFGRSGLTMVGTMMKGKDAIKAMRQEAQDMGIVLDSDVLEQMENYNDEWFRVQQTINGVKAQIAKVLLPAFMKVATTIKTALIPVIKWAKGHIEELRTVAKWVGIGFAVMAGVLLLAMIPVTIALVKLTATLIGMGIAGAMAWIKMMWLPLLIAAGIGLLILIIGDLWTTFTDPEAFTVSRLLWSEWSKFVMKVVDSVFEFITGKNWFDFVDMVVKYWVDKFQVIMDFVKSLGSLFGQGALTYSSYGSDFGAVSMPRVTPPTVTSSNSRSTTIGQINITEPVDVNKFKSFIEDDFSTFIQSMETN